MRKRIVIALGGNALQYDSHTQSAEDQQLVAQQTMEQLLPILKSGHDIVIVHGNGPQVGVLLEKLAPGAEEKPLMPLDTCDAMTQGMIGYWIEKALDKVFIKHGINRKAVAIVTQVLVDAKDPAFENPTKPIGPFYSEAEAAKLNASPDIQMKEDAGRGWRRVVPSPEPKDVLELPIVKDLLEKHHIVVTGGGGGIPVVTNEQGDLIGVEAVIDKDNTAALIADLLQADRLMIVTNVSHVYLNYGKESQKMIEQTTPDEMQEWVDQKHFHEGSMAPKVRAGIKFVRNHPERMCVITSIEQLSDAIEGQSGTVILHPKSS